LNHPRALGDAVVHGRHPPTQGCYDSVDTATPEPADNCQPVDI